MCIRDSLRLRSRIELALPPRGHCQALALTLTRVRATLTLTLTSVLEGGYHLPSLRASVKVHLEALAAA